MMSNWNEKPPKIIEYHRPIEDCRATVSILFGRTEDAKECLGCQGLAKLKNTKIEISQTHVTTLDIWCKKSKLKGRGTHLDFQLFNHHHHYHYHYHHHHHLQYNGHIMGGLVTRYQTKKIKFLDFLCSSNFSSIFFRIFSLIPNNASIQEVV